MAVIAGLAVIAVSTDPTMNGVHVLALMGMTVRTDKNGIIGWLLMAFRAGNACMVSGQGQGMIERCLVPGNMTILVALVTACGIAGCLVIRVLCPFIVGLMAGETDRAFARCIDPVPVAIRACQGLVGPPKRPEVVPSAALPGGVLSAVAQGAVKGKTAG